MPNDIQQSIIILDYSTQKIYITDYNPNLVESYEEYYEILNNEHNLNLTDGNSNCMIVNKPFKIIHL